MSKPTRLISSLPLFHLKALICLTASICLTDSACLADEAQAPMMIFKEGSHCKISLIEPHPACIESQKVIETLRTIFEAYGRNDLKTVAEYITDDCTAIANNHKLLTGKPAILEYIKETLDKQKEDLDSPLLSYTVDQPYACVNGDNAIVTFVAHKVYGGKHPKRLVSHSTDVFVKRDGKWLTSHYVNNWKEAPAASKAHTTTVTPVAGNN